ncbi:MAG: DUF1080 domain-containing protein [Planctomycetota bacterium]
MKQMTVAALLVIASIAPNGFAENRVAESQQKYIAQYEKQPRLPDPADMLLNTDPEPDLTEGFVDLYNGKDLDNWIAYAGYSTFEAADGMIIGQHVKGSPSTYLSTVRDDYTDFVFTAEFKWEIDNNTGVIFRGRVEDRNGKQVVVGPQAEMEDEKKQRFWSGGIYGQSCGGWIYPLWLEAHEEARGAIDRSGWNRVTIHAEGKTVKTWVNGIPAAHWETDEFERGFFSLQIHKAAQGRVLFRRIMVKELPTTSAEATAG